MRKPLFLLLIILMVGMVPVLAQETLTLTQTFTSADEQVTLNYPAEWVTKEGSISSDDGQLLELDLGTDEALLDSDPLSNSDEPFEAGNVRINLVLYERDRFAGGAIPPNTTVVDVLKALVNEEHSTNASINFSTITATTVGEFPAAEVDATNPSSGDSTAWLVDYGTAILGAALYTAPGELEQWKPTAFAIVESLQYAGAGSAEVTPEPEQTAIPTARPLDGVALDLSQTYSNEAGTISFQYPGDWVTEDHSFDQSFSVTTASNNDAMRMNLGSDSDVFASGDVQIQLIVGPANSIANDLPGLKPNASPVEFLQALVNASMLSNSEPTFTFGSVETTSINDRLVARLEVDNGKQGKGLILVMRIQEGVFAAVAVTTASNELMKYEPTARAILGSVVLSSVPITPTPDVETTSEPTPEATSDVALTETFTTDNGAGTFQYPADWVVDDQSGSDDVSVVIATSEDLFHRNLGTSLEAYAPGEVQIQIIAGTTEAITSDTPFPSNGSGDPVEFLTSLVEASKEAGAATGFTFGDVTSDSIGDREAARVQIDIGEDGQASLMVVKVADDALAVVVLSTAQGELQQWETVSRAIVASFQFTDVSPEATPDTEATAEVTPVPEATAEALQTFTTGNNRTTLSFPEGWVKRTLENFGVYVANSDKALNHVVGGKFAPGEVQILVAVDTISNLTPYLNLGVEADASALKFLQALIKAYSTLGTFESPVEEEVVGLPAAYGILHGSGYDVKTTIVEYGNNVVGVFQVIAAPGELDQWTNTVESIIQSVQYTP